MGNIDATAVEAEFRARATKHGIEADVVNAIVEHHKSRLERGDARVSTNLLVEVRNGDLAAAQKVFSVNGSPGSSATSSGRRATASPESAAV